MKVVNNYFEFNLIAGGKRDMIKKVNFTAAAAKEEKLAKILECLEELKVEFADVVDLYEEAGAKAREVETLAEALAAVDDAIDGIHDVID